MTDVPFAPIQFYDRCDVEKNKKWFFSGIIRAQVREGREIFALHFLCLQKKYSIDTSFLLQRNQTKLQNMNPKDLIDMQVFCFQMEERTHDMLQTNEWKKAQNMASHQI